MKLPSHLIHRLFQRLVDLVATGLPSPWDRRLRRWGPGLLWLTWACLSGAVGDGLVLELLAPDIV